MDDARTPPHPPPVPRLSLPLSQLLGAGVIRLGERVRDDEVRAAVVAARTGEDRRAT